MFGQNGQVVPLSSCSGGLSRISIWVTEAAPWRFEVPMQSEPVSPPPITTTCLPAAGINWSAAPGTPCTDLGVAGQEVHGEMHAVQLASRDRQVARLLGPARQHHRVEGFEQLLGGQIDADMGVGVELDALGAHLGDAPVDQRFRQLEIRNAVTQETADPVVLLVNHDAVADPGELLGAASPAGPEPTTATRLPVLCAAICGLTQLLFPGPVGDGAFDGLDGDRLVLQVQGAGLLARRRADPAGDLGEVVGGVQQLGGLFEVTAIHQVVPVRDDVVDRAAFVAEGDAAVHAAPALAARVRRRSAGSTNSS